MNVIEGAAQSCANCAAPLAGAYCQACGQRAHLHDRLSHLLHEFVEGVAHFDGRLWRTLPLLVFNPGRLSREWMEGRRTRYIAPLHVFLFAVFLVFLIPNFTGDRLISFDPAALEGLSAEIRRDEPPPPAVAAGAEDLAQTLGGKAKDAKYYSYKIESLAYKLAIVLAPIGMGILALVTLRRSRTYSLYRHGVVALYGLGVTALTASVLILLPSPVDNVVGWAAMLGLPAHAAAHLRGAYGFSWPAAVARAFVLGLLTFAGFAAFLVSVTLLGLFG